MFIVGVLLISIIVILFLHLSFFKLTKKINSIGLRNILNWIFLILVSAGVIILTGSGRLHSGIIGLLIFCIGGLYLIFNKNKG